MANIKGIELASDIYDLEDTQGRTATQTAQETATNASNKADSNETAIENIQSLIPSTASGSNKLATKADIPYLADSSVSVSSIEDVGPALVALGIGGHAGRIRISNSWYDYISSIQGNVASGGSWIGNVLLWGDDGNLYTLRKGYSSSKVWTISQFQKVQ